MADALDADTLRDTLNRVIGYRELQKAVRSSGRGNFVWGAIFAFLWYVAYGQNGVNLQRMSVFGYIHLGIAVLEIGVGLLKQVRPSAECLLLDALIFAVFAGSNGLRAYLGFAQFGRPDPIAVLLGLYMAYTAVQQVSAYRRLRELYPETPTAAHIRYVNELLAEVRSGDPESDPSALHMGKNLSGKMIGDLLLAADAAGGAFVAPREAVVIDRLPARSDDDRGPGGRLRIDGHEVATFRLTDATWRNHAKWKGV